MEVDASHHDAELLVQGEPLASAQAAMILIHGRGGSAEDILGLTRQIGAPGFAYLAPQAVGNTWYPYSFLMPIAQNEPFLTSALDTVQRMLGHVLEAGIPAEKTVIVGFSQGACLASEFVARNARRYGGLIVFSGGLIGPPETPRDYNGSLGGTPVFLGCSDGDPHIPQGRVDETAIVLARMGADVDKRIYPNMAHTINRDELEAAQSIVDGVLAEE